MSNRSGSAGYKGNIPTQSFVVYPGAINIDELNKPQDVGLYPGPDNQPPVLGLTESNSYGRNSPYQRTTITTFTGSDRGSIWWTTGVSGTFFTGSLNYAGAVFTGCPYGGGTGVTKHRVNIDFGQTVTLDAAIFFAQTDFGGPNPAVFGTTTSATATTGTNLVSEAMAPSGDQFRQKNFTATSSRYWFLECNFGGAGCGGCGSTLQLMGVRTSEGIWLPLTQAIPFSTSVAYNNPLDNSTLFIVDGDSSGLNPDPFVTRQTTSTIYLANRSPSSISFGGNGIIQISGIAGDAGRPYVGQTISGATSSATGRVKYRDPTTYYSYANIASGTAQSATIIYEPTSVASFTTGEKIYSLASTKPEPKLSSFGNTWSADVRLKIGSGLINGSGSLATIINNNDWYSAGSLNFYQAVSGSPAVSASNVGYITNSPSAGFAGNNFVFYSPSGTVLCSGLLYQQILLNTGSGYLDLNYDFSGIYAGTSLSTTKVITAGSGGWD